MKYLCFIFLNIYVLWSSLIPALFFRVERKGIGSEGGISVIIWESWPVLQGAERRGVVKHIKVATSTEVFGHSRTLLCIQI